jgi:hypothetical protein
MTPRFGMLTNTRLFNGIGPAIRPVPLAAIAFWIKYQSAISLASAFA